MFIQNKTKALFLINLIIYLSLLGTSFANSGYQSANIYDIRGIFIDAIKVSNAVDEIQIRAIQPATYITTKGDKISLAAGVYYFAPSYLDIESNNTILNEFGFLDVTNIYLPLDEWKAGDVETADLNDDGLLDIVFSLHALYDGYSDYRPRVWIQTPEGNFIDETDSRMPPTSTPCYDIELFDANSDQHVDIFATGYHSGIYYLSSALFINDGTGHFSDESEARLPQYTNSSWAYFVEPADVDNDQSIDLIVNLFDSSSFPTDSIIIYPVIWMNDGNGFFVEDTLNRIPYQDGHYGFFELAVTDINSDSLVDIIFVNMEMIWTDSLGNSYDTLSGQNACYRNTGDGFFVDETQERMPPQDSHHTRDLAICDIDNDDDEDILEVGFYELGQYDQQVRLLINDGEGYFDVSSNSLPGNLEGFFNDSEFALLNDDQYPDLFMICVLWGELYYDVLLVNNGDGTFSDSSDLLPDNLDFSVSCVLFDHQLDDDNDIFIANAGPIVNDSGQNVLYHNTLNDPSGISEGINILPDVFCLFQNYPNPFNPITKINFILPMPADVKLEVFNLAGQKMSTIKYNNLESGKHSLEWNGSDFSSGIYFYRLQADDFTQLKRMVLLK